MYTRPKSPEPSKLPTSAAEWRARHLRSTPLKMLADPELRLFVDSKIQSMSFVKLSAECVRQFGRKRAPGKTALHKYWKRYWEPGLRPGLCVSDLGTEEREGNAMEKKEVIVDEDIVWRLEDAQRAFSGFLQAIEEGDDKITFTRIHLHCLLSAIHTKFEEALCETWDYNQKRERESKRATEELAASPPETQE